MSHVLLWSQRQNALHIETVETMLSKHRDAYRDNRATDYIPLWIGTEVEVDQAADAIRNTLIARQAVRNLREAA